MCRSQISASQTLASRKFNVFIDLFVGDVHLPTSRTNERKLHALRSWPPARDERGAYSHENQFPDRASLRRSLFLEFPVEPTRDVYRSSHGRFLHFLIIACMP